jgi:para-aminobenzoate synthetase component 1
MKFIPAVLSVISVSLAFISVPKKKSVIPFSMSVVVELNPVPDVEAALRAVADLPHPVLFESALQRGGVGEYSFLSADPCEFRQLDRATLGSDPFAELRVRLAIGRTETLPDLPPFQGGAAGVLS